MMLQDYAHRISCVQIHVLSLVLPEFEDLEESLVDFIFAVINPIDEVHVLFIPVFKFVVITRINHVTRFTNYELAEIVDKGTLPRLH